MQQYQLRLIPLLYAIVQKNIVHWLLHYNTKRL